MVRAATERWKQPAGSWKPSIADLNDPSLLKDIAPAVARLRRAIEQKERILLYGDYDVDGTSAVVILKKGLGLLGGNASFHVPHRLKDGYGMRSEVVEEAAAAGVSLIVSVDTGIRANAVVEHATGLGIDVIVTDHHLPETELPPAAAVLNPNRPDCGYPEKNLCGAGVALKLMDALIRDFGWEQARRERLIDSLLKLVAIATVADVGAFNSAKNRADRETGFGGAGSSAQSRLAGAAGCLRIPGRRVPQCAASGVSGSSANQRRRAHGECRGRDRDVSDRGR